jgi:hypothetical protein
MPGVEIGREGKLLLKKWAELEEVDSCLFFITIRIIWFCYFNR